MSKIEVNQISSQCGSTLTIGQSGDTVTLACGATQTGFGRTGTVDWCTTAKTAPFTGVSGKGYFVNTTCGAVTVTLPATPTAGDIISIKDYARTAGTNNINFCRNGSKMDGDCASGSITTDGESTTLIYVDGTKGWTSILDSTTNTYGAAYVIATGGTIATCGDYKIHAFTSDGTFCVSNAGNPAGSDTVDYLVVAGGGGGGGRCNTVGGGGAGGFRIGAITVPGCAPALVAPGGIPVSIQAYPVTVGAGGLGGNVPPNPSVFSGAPGSNSVFSTITSAGGGGGGAGAGPCGAYKNGGSGGGGADASLGGSGNTPPVSPPQGNDGGDGTPPASQAPSYASGGGGGAGSAGVDATNTKAGDGGNGSSVTDIFGAAPKPFYAPTNGLYSGGGGGGYYTGCGAPPATQGLGGPGGGGSGGASVNTPGTAGTTNTGGGGGGATDTSPYDQSGGNGGSGVVLIRYKFQN
jgi:hypothetical protein